MSWGDRGKQAFGTKNYMPLEEGKDVTQHSGFPSRWCFKSTRGESPKEPSEGDPEQLWGGMGSELSKMYVFQVF